MQAIAVLEALAVYDLATAQQEQKQLQVLVDERDRLLASTRGDLFKRLYDAAQAVVTAGAWADDEKCPLCESDLGTSISAHISGQLSQYADAARKAVEIKRSEEHTSELQSLMRISYAVFCLKKKNTQNTA